MARGHDLHKQRLDDINNLGRVLNRRARSQCELCSERTSLKIVELPPPPEDPDVEHALMVCARCVPAVVGGGLAGAPDTWRFLGESIWSETTPVQIAAVRATRLLAAADVSWATEALDSLYLDEAVTQRL